MFRYLGVNMVTPTELPMTGRTNACMIEVDGRTYCIDPLEDAMKIISKRWMLLVIGVLGNLNNVRFGEAMKMIPGISARALSSCLTDLQARDLATRHVDAAAAPPAVSYALTEAGKELRLALIPIVRWAEVQAAGDL